MSKLKLGLVACLAVVAASAVMASSAFAATPSLLLSGATMGAGSTIAGTGGAGTLSVLASAALAITCASTSFSGTLSSTTAGTVNLVFKTCKTAGGETCKTTGSAAGEIAFNGAKFEFVYDLLGTTGLGGAVRVELPGTLVISCTGGLINPTIEVKGDVLGLVKPINTVTTALEIVFTATNGDATEVKYWKTTEQATASTTSLLTKVGAAGKFESSGDTTTVTVNLFNGATTKSIEAMA